MAEASGSKWLPGLEQTFAEGSGGRQPWRHQVEAVARLLALLHGGHRSSPGEGALPRSGSGSGQNLLVQHATGSGKSATMALLMHALGSFRDGRDRGFALVLLLSDRRQLDRQLGDTVEAFLRRSGSAARGGCTFRRADDGGLSLAKALGAATDAGGGPCRVVVTTKQKFDRLLRGDEASSTGLLGSVFRRGRVALICEECHRAHFRGSATAAAVSRLFGLSAEAAEEGAAAGSRGAGRQPEDLTYIGFTATPDARALRMFGHCARGAAGEPRALRPAHCYHLGEAERDHVVIDVLMNYEEAPDQFDGPPGATEIERKSCWLLKDLQAKMERFQSADFRQVAKAMIVCRSRADVVAYVRALRSWLMVRAEGLADNGGAGALPEGRSLRGLHGCRGVFGFFSGEIDDHSETQINGGLELHEACARARILVVCQKLETGYDEPRLAAMYVDRPLEGAVATVQVLSRLNRQLPGKSHVNVVDFHGHAAQAAASFSAFRREVMLEAAPSLGESATPTALAAVEARLERLLCCVGTARPDTVAAELTEYLRLCRALKVQISPAFARLAKAVASSVASGDALPQQRQVLLEERVATHLLQRVVPSSRYGGLGKKLRAVAAAAIAMEGKPQLAVRGQESLEAGFRKSMRRSLALTMPSSCSPRTPSSSSSTALESCVLVADDHPGLASKLTGPPHTLGALWRAVERHRSFFEQPPAGRRGSPNVVYPVFICSKGRHGTGLLEWRAPHCFGQDASSKGGESVSMPPIVIVVEPQEEELYRAAWPDALLLALPRANGTAIGYTRWVVQVLCTAAHEEKTGRPFRFPFVWMADDLLVAFYRLEPLPAAARAPRDVEKGTKAWTSEPKRCALRGLPDRGFREAFLAVQRREDICDIALAGFLRDRGSAICVRRRWVLDGSLALQKVVLLNLPKLAQLGVWYCPVLRKSEDLAICYEVARRPGGHLLKAQCYCYRAVHLERGGAEEVRSESRQNLRATLGELVLGGQGAVRQLPGDQRATTEAILAWLQLAQSRRPAAISTNPSTLPAAAAVASATDAPGAAPAAAKTAASAVAAAGQRPRIGALGVTVEDEHGDLDDGVEAAAERLLEDLRQRSPAVSGAAVPAAASPAPGPAAAVSAAAAGAAPLSTAGLTPGLPARRPKRRREGPSFYTTPAAPGAWLQKRRSSMDVDAAS